MTFPPYSHPAFVISKWEVRAGQGLDVPAWGPALPAWSYQSIASVPADLLWSHIGLDLRAYCETGIIGKQALPQGFSSGPKCSEQQEVAESVPLLTISKRSS